MGSPGDKILCKSKEMILPENIGVLDMRKGVRGGTKYGLFSSSSHPRKGCFSAYQKTGKELHFFRRIDTQ